MSTQSKPQQSDRILCRVKWFGKGGYGFVTDINDADKEYFVHHSALVVTENENEDGPRIYKKLEKGEYIECSVIVDNKNRNCAVNVTGVQKGPLMCESNPLPSTRRNYSGRHYSSSRRRYHRRPRSRSRSRSRSR